MTTRMRQRLHHAGLFAILLFGWAFIMYMYGFTWDGFEYGQWPPIDDHPTNWSDTVLHPEAAQ
jgi:hypothetical protein